MDYFVRFRGKSWEVVRKTWLISQVVAYARTKQEAIAVMVKIATEENTNVS
jgi:hypothetical protein